MANTSNSNYVNISNLPQTQEAVDSDLIILQTENGTQTITFNNLNVVKTDAVGNASVLGSISGNDAYFTTLSTANSIDSPNYYANGVEGYTALNNFYNKFTINNGLVTSATYVSRKDDDFNYLTQTYIPNLSSWQNSIYTRTIDKLGVGNLNPFQSSAIITIGGFFSDYPDIAPNQIKPYHILLTFSNFLSAYPYVVASSIGSVANALQFEVRVPPTVTAPITVWARVLITYTVSNGNWIVYPQI